MNTEIFNYTVAMDTNQTVSFIGTILNLQFDIAMGAMDGLMTVAPLFT